jgi:probable phosphoglycerate mutase
VKNVITIQHTQSVHHTNGMIGAWTDWDLSDLGQKQAENIGKTLKQEINSEKFIMYSSDLKRAKQTAELVGLQLGITPILRKELREVNAGIDTPTTNKWYSENAVPLCEGVYDPDYKPFPGAESDRELWNRLYSFVEEIINAEQENIIIVSHGTALSFFYSLWLNETFDTIKNKRLGSNSGGVSKLFIGKDGRRAINTLNDMYYVKNNIF